MNCIVCNKYLVKEQVKFCSRSCAAKHNNSIRDNSLWKLGDKQVTCTVCNSTFTVNKRSSVTTCNTCKDKQTKNKCALPGCTNFVKRPKSTFCSRKCKDKSTCEATKERQNRTCLACGASFLAKIRKSTKYCSYTCYDSSRPAPKKTYRSLVDSSRLIKCYLCTSNLGSSKDTCIVCRRFTDKQCLTCSKFLPERNKFACNQACTVALNQAISKSIGNARYKVLATVKPCDLSTFDGKDVVYYVLGTSKTKVKIGYTKGISKRLSMIQSSCDDTVTLLAFEFGDRFLEKEKHIKYEKYWYAGEWFHYSDELKEYVESLPKH